MLLAKLGRIIAELIVDGERVLWRTVELVRHDVLSVGEQRDCRHAGTMVVDGRGNVIDDRTPCLQVVRDLMNHFLAVFRVPLVRVVADDLTVVFHQSRFPDRGFSIVGQGDATVGDMGNKVPGFAITDQ